ncbi:MAG: GIY-YIG nuclease family protein [Lachnospiraceae bacterium]|nr:GIY-YIG nuclease family protein [Lachnospiraceae bacterium]MCI9185203.1 GIY-YIG nuclease family protein [Lachnospiraceae bacterium]
MNYTYLLKCADGSFYCGWTNHLKKRVEAHNKGMGAKYTKGRRPVVLAYYEEYATKQEAMRREYELKQLTHAQKSDLAALCPKTTMPEGIGQEKQ